MFLLLVAKVMVMDVILFIVVHDWICISFCCRGSIKALIIFVMAIRHG